MTKKEPFLPLTRAERDVLQNQSVGNILSISINCVARILTQGSEDLHKALYQDG